MTGNTDNHSYYKYLTWGILLTGIILRIVVFLQNRSLFIDEGALASQIVSKNFSAFFEPLSYQFSPPIFSCLVKSSTLLFGANEYALRLVPLLAGIITLLFFAKLIFHLFTPKIYLFSLAVYSFTIPFIHYSTECKQYSTDVLITTVLLWLFYKYYKTRLRGKELLLAGVLGIVLVWCSMPVVFTLFGLGLYWLYQAYRKNDFKQLVKLLFICLTWLISFTIYFFLILKKDAGIGSLVKYHTDYFFPLLPTSFTEIYKALGLLMSFLKTILRATVLSQLLGLALFVAGIIQLWKSNKSLLIPLFIPILSCIIASGIGLYSLIPRMILFAMPLVILILTYGVKFIFNKWPYRGVGILCILMVVVLINIDTYKYFFKPFQKDEIRPVIEYVREHQKESHSVFVHHLGITAFQFYQYHHESKSSFELQRVTENNWKDKLKNSAANQPLPCWLILTHLNPQELEEVVNEFEKYGSIADEFKSINSSAILIK